MVYTKTEWKNREVERPRTFTIQDNPDGTVTLLPAEGTIVEAGTPIIAANMNNIEEGILEAGTGILAYATASGTNTYTVSIPSITALAEGLSVKIKFTNANTGAATLNINSLGAKSIVKSNGSTLSSGNIKAGQVVHLVYTGSVFQCVGEGGEYGTATAGEVLSGYTIGTENGVVNGTLALTGDAVAGDVLSGKTFYNTNAKTKLTGAIPSKSAATITPGTTNQVIAANQYLQEDQIILGDPDLIAPNILNIANIFGVQGTAIAGIALISTQSGTLTPSSSVSEISAAISTVDITKSILICEDVGGINANKTGICGVLTSNSVTFYSSYNALMAYNNNFPSGVTIQWKVLTFSGNISVQRGVQTANYGNNNTAFITISPVNISRSFLVINAASQSGGLYRGRVNFFNSETNIWSTAMSLDDPAYNYIQAKIGWQVVSIL